MASVLLDDKSGRIESTLFSETYERYRDAIGTDALLVVEGSLVPDEYRGGLSLRVDTVESLDDYWQASCQGMLIEINESMMRSQGITSMDVINQLKEHLSPYAGGSCRVTVSYQRMDASVRLRLGDQWSLKVNHDLLRQLRKWLGDEAVKIRMGVPGTEITTSPEPEMA
jgi:DNA polymerase-3 subunit alpha